MVSSFGSADSDFTAFKDRYTAIVKEQEGGCIDSSIACMRMISGFYSKYAGYIGRDGIVTTLVKDFRGKTEELYNLQKGVFKSDEVPRDYSDIIKGGTDALGLFVRDIVLERLEVLHSCIYSLFYILFVGNRTLAGKVCEHVSTYAIRTCLSVFFFTHRVAERVRLRDDLGDDTTRLQNIAKLKDFYNTYDSGGLNRLKTYLASVQSYTIDGASDRRSQISQSTYNALSGSNSSPSPAVLVGGGWINYEPEGFRVKTLSTMTENLGSGSAPSTDRRTASRVHNIELVRTPNRMTDLLHDQFVAGVFLFRLSYRFIRAAIKFAYQYDPIFRGIHMVDRGMLTDLTSSSKGDERFAVYVRSMLVAIKSPLTLTFDPNETIESRKTILNPNNPDGTPSFKGKEALLRIPSLMKTDFVVNSKGVEDSNVPDIREVFQPLAGSTLKSRRVGQPSKGKKIAHKR
jgi:hypothetical protein